MKSHINIFSAVLFILVSSCTERIDIKLDDSAVRLVVEGSVTNEMKVHTIILSKTTSYFDSQKPPSVTGAVVSITSGAGTVKLHEAMPGVYRTDSLFVGRIERSYTLDIQLDEPVGGYRDYSATSSMPEPVRLDSIKLIYHPDWSDNGFYEVQTFFQDPKSQNYYRFLILRNGEMMTDTLDEWFVSDDKFFNGSYLFGASVAFLNQGEERERLNPGDEITVELDCIEKGYATFLQDAQSELWGSNPLFSGPPANVKGNISNNAIGFFSAYTISRASARAVKK
jgi:hypothetical protein